MRRSVTYLFYFIVLIVLGLASLFWGLVSDSVPVKTIGVMQLSAFKNGLSFYQVNRLYYYSFSPYNDYLLFSDGSRSTFLSEDEVRENRFSTNFHTSQSRDILNAILAYFNAADPQITFYGEKNKIEYYTKSENNTLTVTGRLKATSNNPQTLGMTLTYYGMDFVYDKSGNFYGYNSGEELANFTKFYKVSLTAKKEDFRIPIPGKTIVIVSPYIAGALVVRANNNQAMWVNRNTKMVEVEEQVYPKDGYLTNSVKIEVYDSPVEAQNNL